MNCNASTKGFTENGKEESRNEEFVSLTVRDDKGRVELYALEAVPDASGLL
jgi:hypothetical protein